MTVSELSREQMLELKQNYLIQFYEETAENVDGPSWEELSNADEIVDDWIIYDVYGHYSFCNDDFFCTAGG